MAVTTEKSTQVTNSLLRGYIINRSPDDHGKVLFFRFDFTQSAAIGDIGSTIDLFYLPAGRWRPIAGFLDNPLFGAARTLDIGHTGGRDPNGVAFVADPDYFSDNYDVAAAHYGANVFNVPTATGVLDSMERVLVQALLAGGTIPAGTTLKGAFIFGAD